MNRRDPQIGRISKAVAGDKLPKISTQTCERHVGPILIDPAAETEINFYLQACSGK